MKEMIIDYTDFVERQFKEDFKGTNLSKYNKHVLLSQIREEFSKLVFGLDVSEPGVEATSEGGWGEVKLCEGYMPFCKLLFIENPTDVKTGTVPITMANERFLQSDYRSRRPDEKKVLTRFLNIPSCLRHEIPVADYLMIILYSKEQIDSENLEYWKKNGGDKPTLFYGDYGIVSINAQMVDFEEPMNPITMMRNALGEADGGSGAPMNDGAYDKSIEFWSKNAIVG